MGEGGVADAVVCPGAVVVHFGNASGKVVSCAVGEIDMMEG